MYIYVRGWQTHFNKQELKNAYTYTYTSVAKWQFVIKCAVINLKYCNYPTWYKCVRISGKLETLVNKGQTQLQWTSFELITSILIVKLYRQRVT